MKAKKAIVVTAVALALMSVSNVALASTGESTNQETSGSSTTVPAKRDRAEVTKFRADMLVWQQAMSAWVKARATATSNHLNAVAAASTTLKDALAAATSKDARKAATEAFKAAREEAKATLKAALDELGDRPVRPTR